MIHFQEEKINFFLEKRTFKDKTVKNCITKLYLKICTVIYYKYNMIINNLKYIYIDLYAIKSTEQILFYILILNLPEKKIF